MPRPLQRECSQQASAPALCHTIPVIAVPGWVPCPIHCAYSFEFVRNVQTSPWPQCISAMCIAVDGSCGDVHLEVNHGSCAARDCCVLLSILLRSGHLGFRNTTVSLTAGCDPCADVLSPPGPSSSSLGCHQSLAVSWLRRVYLSSELWI